MYLLQATITIDIELLIGISIGLITLGGFAWKLLDKYARHHDREQLVDRTISIARDNRKNLSEIKEEMHQHVQDHNIINRHLALQTRLMFIIAWRINDNGDALTSHLIDELTSSMEELDRRNKEYQSRRVRDVYKPKGDI